GIANALPIGTALSVTGSLELNGFDQQVASIVGTSAGVVTNSSATGVVFTVNNSVTDIYAGAIDGNLAFTKTGAGLLTLSHANTWTGTTTVGAGTLKQGILGAIPDSTDLNVNGGVDLNGFNLQVASIIGTGVVTNGSTTAATFTINNAVADLF